VSKLGGRRDEDCPGKPGGYARLLGFTSAVIRDAARVADCGEEK
jgi:hypothetical protein